MAPALTETAVDPQAVLNYEQPSKAVFPDGIKTSGQRNPNYDQLVPYEQFPKEIVGQTVWDNEDYKNNPEQWTHYFSEEEVKEMSDASDDFIASGIPLTGITKTQHLAVYFDLHLARCPHVGIQFLSNAHILHSRTAYKDYPPPHPARHLMRLWLATPETEGGWRLPFADSAHKKRGGIQVNDTPPRAPLDAE